MFNTPICGIYGILNTRNEKIYVGQSRDIQSRKKSHKYTLENGRHCNIHLQRAYNKDKEFFKFRILEECLSNVLNEKEVVWINTFGGIDSNNNYNLGMVSGGEHSKETKEKMSLAAKGKVKSEAHKHKISIVRKDKSYTEIYGKRAATEILKRSNSHKGKIPWNKGLTKADPRVANNCRNLPSNNGVPAWNKGLKVVNE